MSKKLQNDYIIDIFQDFCEIKSLTKILKDSLTNENRIVSITDIENALEILVAKVSNSKIALNKYIDNSY